MPKMNYKLTKFIYMYMNFFSENKTCLPRSVEEFPGNFMTFEETRDGGFVIHILIAVYLFGALAIVCDDYFVASLEMICEGQF